MANVSHSGGTEPLEPPKACYSSQLRSTLQPWRLLKSILSQPVQRMAILVNVSQNADLPERLAFWRLAQRSLRDRRRKANLPTDSSGKNEQNGRLLFCDGRDAFRQVPAGGADCSHIYMRAAALATARRRERRFQGSADQSGGCLALWPQFESGAGAQAKAPFSRNVR